MFLFVTMLSVAQTAPDIVKPKKKISSISIGIASGTGSSWYYRVSPTIDVTLKKHTFGIAPLFAFQSYYNDDKFNSNLELSGVKGIMSYRIKEETKRVGISVEVASVYLRQQVHFNNRYASFLETVNIFSNCMGLRSEYTIIENLSVQCAAMYGVQVRRSSNYKNYKDPDSLIESHYKSNDTDWIMEISMKYKIKII